VTQWEVSILCMVFDYTRTQMSEDLRQVHRLFLCDSFLEV